MRAVYVLLTLLAVPSIATLAQTQKVATPQDEAQLRQIEATTAQFEQQNDSSKMDLLADDWVCVSGKKTLTKKEFEESVNRNFAAHGNGPSPYTLEKRDMQIFVFGDTAVVTYLKEYRQTPDTTKFFDEDTTDVFARGPKGWLWQFSRTNPIPLAVLTGTTFDSPEVFRRNKPTLSRP